MIPTPYSPPAGIHGVLSVLADVAEGSRRSRALEDGPPERLNWLTVAQAGNLADPAPVLLDAKTTRSLVAVDSIRPGEDTLRLGWLWVMGRRDESDALTRVFEPLITTVVRVEGSRLSTTGEPTLTTHLVDRTLRLELEAGLEPGGAAYGDVPLTGAPVALDPADLDRLPRLCAFARRLASSIGLDTTVCVPVDPAPRPTADHRLRVVVGLGIYADEVTADFSAAGSLRQWHAQVGTTWTALHSMYLAPPERPQDPPTDVPSAFPLTHAQQACLTEARTSPVTVISGAPGTGKTHTVAAIVGDAVAHGRSVLVAAKSDATVEAIVELIGTRPGPDPVVFGASQKRRDLAQRLASGQVEVTPAATVDASLARVHQRTADRDRRWRDAAETLAGLDLLSRPGEAKLLYDRVPGLARADIDLFEVRALAEQVGDVQPPWWRVGARRRWNRLLELLGVTTPPSAGDIHQASALARAARSVHTTDDPFAVGPDWETLAAAQRAVQDAAGEWMDALASDERRLTRQVRGVQAALATALRASRFGRRRRLAELVDGLTQALPVWIGTLGDIDDLLPMAPALFDLVILDEAASIDQPRAASALLRGSKTVIVGDPHQLRHVSFVADDDVAEALERHVPGASPGLRGKLDIRRNSIFDVAAAVAPIRHLDEHFRSGAHLFAFPGRRLYDDRVRVATVTPVSDRADLIVVHGVTGERNDAKVVQREVAAIMDRLTALRDDGAASVGVLSPFRAQADAIESAALDTFNDREIAALGLRVGTVHAFQGMERDIVLVSLGIGPDDGGGTWRFASDPHLFAVLTTRARERLEWFVSAKPPAGTLLGDYLDEQDRPPDPPRRITTDDPWTAAIGHGVQDAGLAVSAPYDVGHHPVDLCAIDGGRYLAVFTAIHPDGPDAHIRRQLDLARAGWPIVHALPAVWRDRTAELAVRLAERVRDST